MFRLGPGSAVLHCLGNLFLFLGGVLLLPIPAALLCREPQHVLPFIGAAILALAVGGVLLSVFRAGRMGGREAAAVCALGWVGCSLLGAVPYCLILHLGYFDAFFETLSGFTTTGFTVLRHLERLPRAILFWRSLTQFLGGLGILTFFLLTAFRGSAAHRLFSAEARHGGGVRLTPGVWTTTVALWRLYAALALIEFVTLRLVGLDTFDALTHAFTLASTGGFSNYDASIGHFAATGHPHARALEWTIMLFMAVGGVSFLVYYRLLQRQWRALWEGVEIRWYWGLLALITVAIFVEHVLKVRSAGAPWRSWSYLEYTLRQSAFTTVAISATGYSVRELSSHFFFGFARQLLVFLMLVGGCVGSTAGGIKVLRIVVLSRIVGRQILRLSAPQHAVFPLVLEGRRIDEEEVQRITALAFGVVALALLGGALTAFATYLPTFRALSGMCSAVGNIGPCLIPARQIAGLPVVVKALYALGMLAGRLEIFPVLIVLSREAWR